MTVSVPSRSASGGVAVLSRLCATLSWGLYPRLCIRYIRIVAHRQLQATTDTMPAQLEFKLNCLHRGQPGWDCGWAWRQRAWRMQQHHCHWSLDQSPCQQPPPPPPSGQPQLLAAAPPLPARPPIVPFAPPPRALGPRKFPNAPRGGAFIL
jgi:hypothetical protein